MISPGKRLAALAVGVAMIVPLAGCGSDGITSLASIGAPGTGGDAYEITARIPSAAGLVKNAPVMINDTTVGSVGDIEIKDWTAEVALRLDKGVTVPTGSHAMIGMTSVLGSSHIAIVPPEKKSGEFVKEGGSLPLPSCPEQKNIALPEGKPVPDITAAQQVDPCMYPTTEQVLSSLSVVLNGGGLSQVGDVVHELSDVFGGHGKNLRSLIPRLDTLVGDLDDQTGNIISAMEGLDRLTASINAQTPTVEKALESGPEILQLLVDQRKNLTTALGNVGDLSSTVNDVLQENGDDIKTIVPNLRELLEQLSQTGPALAGSLRVLLTFPFKEDRIDDIVKGDYVNSDLVLDLTFGRLNKTMISSVSGPEGVFGTPAREAKRGANPFAAPLKPGPTKRKRKDPANPSPSELAPKNPASSNSEKSKKRGAGTSTATKSPSATKKRGDN
ncbi:MlaD family protein [Gordonia zhaorongruii]|uniref:MlaD family protein n=1 Tax=Gordonia zhaorongruii TaxID=2597659 RepID=UPI00117D0C4D|nr:MlaD family protein [Gordonia zhaorongruii]